MGEYKQNEDGWVVYYLEDKMHGEMNCTGIMWSFII